MSSKKGTPKGKSSTNNAKTPAEKKAPRDQKKDATSAQSAHSRTRAKGKEPDSKEMAPVVNQSIMLAPQATVIAYQKAKFIEELSREGTVTKACEFSGLKVRTAYDHFRTDEDFAQDWLEALNTANDELIAIARERAGDRRDNGSARILVHLLEKAERQQQWRNRVQKVGELALEAVNEFAKEENWSDDMKFRFEEKLLTKFSKVPLI